MFKVKFLRSAYKDLTKMDKFEARRVSVFLKNNLEGCLEPRYIGKAIQYLEPKNWRYSVGKIRVLCEIDDKNKIIYIHAIVHRKNAYK